MTNSYSLDDLKADLDKEFAPMTLDVAGEKLVLQNLMRVDANPRRAVMDALKEVEALEGEEDKEQTPEEVAQLSAALETILRNVTADGKGDKLVAALGGDLLLAMRIMERWAEATQPGEAQNSPA